MTLRKSIKYLVLNCMLVGSLGAAAQVNSASPYSTYGVGDPEPSALAPQQSMGGEQTAVVSAYNINLSNPAAIAALVKPAFDVGFKTMRHGITSGGVTTGTNVGYFKNMSFAFPISKKWRAGFGALPYSRMGYSASTTEFVEDFGTVSYDYSGNGGLNKVYFTNSYSLVRDSLNVLAIGLNANFVFGNFTRSRFASPSISAGAFSTQAIDFNAIRGFNFDFGAFYLRKLSKRSRIVLAGTYDLGNGLRNEAIGYGFTMSGITVQTINDTVYSYTDTSTFNLPSALSFGLAYELGTKLVLAANYKLTNWSESQLDDNPLLDASTASIGFQFAPDVRERKRFFKMLRYRGGFRYANTRLQTTSGEQISELGINFGVGLPLVLSGSTTNINLGMEVGQRGADQPGMIREQFASFTVGITYSPSRFDPWFLKRKID